MSHTFHVAQGRIQYVRVMHMARRQTMNNRQGVCLVARVGASLLLAKLARGPFHPTQPLSRLSSAPWPLPLQ
jgi:hypothetical protein